jgi:hypothetical protein
VNGVYYSIAKREIAEFLFAFALAHPAASAATADIAAEP